VTFEEYESRNVSNVDSLPEGNNLTATHLYVWFGFKFMNKCLPVFSFIREVWMTLKLKHVADHERTAVLVKWRVACIDGLLNSVFVAHTREY